MNSVSNRLSCGKCIAKLAMDREDHDPRTWHCESLALNGGYACRSPILTGGYFKKEMERKIKKEVKDILDPAGYAENIWQEIKEDSMDYISGRTRSTNESRINEDKTIPG